MIDKKSVVTIGLIVSSVIVGYVLWSHVKQEKKCPEKSNINDKEESKED